MKLGETDKERNRGALFVAVHHDHALDNGCHSPCLCAPIFAMSRPFADLAADLPLLDAPAPVGYRESSGNGITRYLEKTRTGENDD